MQPMLNYYKKLIISLKHTPLPFGIAVLAPIIMCTTTLVRSFLLNLCYLCTSIITILLIRFTPLRLPHFIRILSYSLLGALVYIPLQILCKTIAPQENLGIYLPLLTVGMLLSAASMKNGYHAESSFSAINFLSAIMTLCIGFLVIGAVREFLGYGTLLNHKILENAPFSAIRQPCMCLILLGILAAVLNRAARQGEEQTDVSVH